MPTITGYKFITSDMTSKNGDQTWTLKRWYKHEGTLKICEQGFHACEKPLDSLQYIYGDRWFIVEARGKIIKGDGKFVASEMRLIKEIPVKKVVVPFACFCARQCLKSYEDKYPKDNRPRKAIEAAEAHTKHPTEKNMSAARSAAESAGSAAWSAESAESAAWSAESAARSAESAGSAAESARSAAGSAAWSAESAARSAAWSAESAALSATTYKMNKELERLIKWETK